MLILFHLIGKKKKKLPTVNLQGLITHSSDSFGVNCLIADVRKVIASFIAGNKKKESQQKCSVY